MVAPPFPSISNLAFQSPNILIRNPPQPRPGRRMDLRGLSVIYTGLEFTKEDVNGVPIGYKKGESCLENLKDLRRFLRRDDPQALDVFKQVCKWNMVSNYLIPIIEQYQNDRN